MAANKTPMETIATSSINVKAFGFTIFDLLLSIGRGFA
jgi:hypothetical protein